MLAGQSLNPLLVNLSLPDLEGLSEPNITQAKQKILSMDRLYVIHLCFLYHDGLKRLVFFFGIPILQGKAAIIGWEGPDNFDPISSGSVKQLESAS